MKSEVSLKQKDWLAKHSNALETLLRAAKSATSADRARTTTLNSGRCKEINAMDDDRREDDDGDFNIKSEVGNGTTDNYDDDDNDFHNDDLDENKVTNVKGEFIRSQDSQK